MFFGCIFFVIICVDFVLGFIGFCEDDILLKYKVFLEIGKNKIINKNLVVKKVIV